MAFVRLTEKQLKEEPLQQLSNLKRTKDFLVAIDTDGCVTDNMNGKQMLIFHPQYMEFYQLWAIESYFREAAEYYNLFSVHRGCNRFLAVQLTLQALYQRQDAQKILKEKKIELPGLKPLDDYVAYCSQNNLGLGNPSLEKFLNEHPLNLALYKLLGWSEAVNRTFPYVNLKIPLFENVKEALKLMAESADILVVSQTPYDDLANYWEVQDITDYVQIIAGQEMGSKAYHIEAAKKVGGYETSHILMLGDGDGDLKAVKKNNGLFYPVPPGYENQAWKEFPDYFQSFLKGRYTGAREEKLLDVFTRSLLTSPAWEKPGYDHIKAYREKQEIRKALYAKLNSEGRLLIL